MPVLTPSARSASSERRAVLVSAAVAGAVVLLTLTWAKWLPYTERIGTLSGSHAWKGSSVLTVGGVEPGDAPSWHAATTFTSAYVQAVWKALVAALLISAALVSLVPRGPGCSGCSTARPGCRPPSPAASRAPRR